VEGLKKGREGGKVESGEGEPKGLKQRPQYEAGGLITDDMTALRTELPEGVVRKNKKGKRRGAEGGGTEVWRTGNEGGWQLNRSETNRKECGTFA
jgi:hypothetical protein